MGKDHPDWGGIYSNTQSYPLFDQAELAARLGSPITYDRRGSLLWWYDFSHGIGDVGPVAGGGGGVVSLSSSIWERPPFSCVLQSGTTVGSTTYIERGVAVPQGTRIGWQASIRASSNVSKLQLLLRHYDGSNRWYTYLLANLDNSTLAVLTNESGEVTLDSSFPDLTTGYYFAHFKLVVDLSDHTLVRGMVDDNEYDLTSYTMGSVADASAPHVLGRVANQGLNGVLATANVDSLIFTAAEP